ncbi:hypothetical protein MVEN_00896800 [Mycena venus]|uniref:Uncharacterized protein n=1 Tax=Mycena venus TaxID=2733690 RepID=A0A8H6YEX7_9AGAR|nr:hypothetical protein MVEN_00896800 [Mycena venus]
MDPTGLLSPRLPPELECKIFTITSLSRPTTIPKLMLIAWRVKSWVEPLLYRVILLRHRLGSIHQILGFPTFTAEILDRVIQDKTPAFLQESARHLFLDGSSHPSSLATVLTACNGVTNLFVLSSRPKFLPSLAALRCVRHLFINVEALVNAPNTLLRSVTHLELRDLDTPALVPILALTPLLTHVAFHGAPPSATLLRALCADTRLQCIVFFLSAQGMVDIRSLATDIPVVALQLKKDLYEHWLSGAAGEDFWSVAESSIAARRACETEQLEMHDLQDS